MLDTGSYTFIGLEMKDLGKGIWLDGRKAKSLTLVGCRFEGKGKGLGVLIGKRADIQFCSFIQLETGVQFSSLKDGVGFDSIGKVHIRSNHFWGNYTSVFLEKGKVEVDFYCNYFSPGLRENAIGIYFGKALQLLFGELNGDGAMGNKMPGGNVWPKKRNQFESPLGWVSLWNENPSNALSYNRYIQEFVGTVFPITGKNAWRIMGDRLAPTPWYIRDFCIKQFPNNPEGFRQCIFNPQDAPDNLNNLLPDFCYTYDDPIFPEPDPYGIEEESILGDAVPNPSKETATISLNWPKEKGTLILFELGSGKVVWKNQVTKGKTKIDVPVKSFSAGVYGYRLEGDCPCPEPKRLVVVN